MGLKYAHVHAMLVYCTVHGHCVFSLLCHRLVFERAIQLSLSARKMKFFFKRYLDFELECGTPATVEAVREKAEEFVDRERTESGIL